ncbi:sodium:calcium antiporter [Alteribacillus sp. HJP-4]|uniref:sodium:calcium antiporter n=1 Tax=Alteribacillus sp. HJP-4 TaxID=2775394 RepID=UPI0035CD034F
MALISISIFIAAAIISVFAAIKLSKYADIISKETKMGGMLAGMLLLAVATSLPELTASISAGVIGSPDIAIGNGVGSILFNIFVLFLFDIHFRQKRLFLGVSSNHIYTGVIALLLCVIIGFALLVRSGPDFLGVSLTSFVIVIIYITGLTIVSRKQHLEMEEQEPVQFSRKKSVTNLSLKTLAWRFLIFAFVIFISGSALTVSGDMLAESTGISATAVGSFLIALATSLPDAVGVYVALKVANINLAVGTILGSNLFNVASISTADVFYRSGSIWEDAGPQNVVTAAAAFSLTASVMLILNRKKSRTTITYLMPSLTAVAIYIGYGVYIFIF